ncbi:MAG: hypothetical protein GY803_24740, partial [Chloroflexi bacterium]|nr:hypothetical protein [Chloroflexota bacterium]
MSVYTPANSTFQIKVRAGLAVDAHGRQIVQSKTSSPIDIPAEAANNSRWLYVVFHQQPEDMQSSGQGVQGETRWLEAPYYFTTAAVLGVDDTYTGPDWNAYISQGEGPPPPVLLAKLTVDGNGGVSIDETVRQYSGVRLPGPGSIAPVLRTDTNGNVGLWQVDGNKLSERLTVTPAGHLGINSHAPTAALEIGSTLRATRNGQALVGLKISPTFDAGGRSNIKNHGLIVEHGSVGIGTTDPGGFKLRVNGDLHANKVVVQNGVNGGNTRGLWMWSAGDSNWGIYMGQSGSARSLSGGTAVAGAGFSSHAVRFRTYASETNGLIYENSNEELNLSVRGNDGQTYIRGSVGIGATAPAGLLEIKGSAA